MIETLTIDGYRGFRHYEVRGLKRVNLLTGKNNAGKTSVLEAVQLLAESGHVRILHDHAERRGERLRSDPDGDRPNGFVADISHSFNGYDLIDAKTFSIRSSPDGAYVHIRFYRIDGGDKTHPPGTMVLSRALGGTGKVQPDIVLTDGGGLEVRKAGFKSALRSCFLVPGSIGRSDLADRWAEAIETKRDWEPVAAMRVIAPNLKQIFYIGRSSTRVIGEDFLAEFDGLEKRVALGSQGDGMKRLLDLSLGLIRATRGTLLVDEIDTGLHYSILGDMWKMVVETAVKHDVQVFATTHSFDCIRGLAWLCESFPELGNEVSLQKIEPTLEHSVALGAKEILVADRTGIEVR